MKPPEFDYIVAETPAEAVEHLARHDGAAKLIAGGQSLMPMLNFRLLQPDALIDVSRMPGLNEIAAADDHLRVGAAVRHRQLMTNAAVVERFPVLAAAMNHVAHTAIRNRGTIGGSLAHADPAAELPMLTTLLDGVIEVLGPEGARDVAAGEFFLGPLTPDLAEDEMIVAVRLPFAAAGAGWGFEEVARRAGDFALAGAGATMDVAAGAISAVRIGMLGVDETPVRIAAAEASLAGGPLNAESRAAAVAAVRDAVNPMSDLQASPDYRRHLAGVLAGRALDAAWTRANGGDAG